MIIGVSKLGRPKRSLPMKVRKRKPQRFSSLKDEGKRGFGRREDFEDGKRLDTFEVRMMWLEQGEQGREGEEA